VIQFFVQMTYFKLSLEIDPIVTLRSQAILRFLPLLTHHDDGSLKRGNCRQNKIKKNVGIGIETLAIGREFVASNLYCQGNRK
jgi:hypothetical protein